METISIHGFFSSFLSSTSIPRDSKKEFLTRPQPPPLFLQGRTQWNTCIEEKEKLDRLSNLRLEEVLPSSLSSAHSENLFFFLAMGKHGDFPREFHISFSASATTETTSGAKRAEMAGRRDLWGEREIVDLLQREDFCYGTSSRNSEASQYQDKCWRRISRTTGNHALQVIKLSLNRLPHILH